MTDIDIPKKKTIYSQSLQHLIEFYLPKIKLTENNKDAAPTIHLKIPQILCILQENDLINMCMQDPTSSRVLDVLFKRLWELVHTREMESMWAGFVLLDEVFRNCSHEKLNANFESWTKDFQDALSVKKKLDKGSALPRGLGAWCTLAARASEWADLKRSCSSHVPSIATALLTPLANDNEFSDETKIECINHFCTLIESMNTAVKPQVPKIEAACLSYLFHHNFILRSAASRLFSFLPKCFSASSMHLTPFVEKTIEHAHLFLDILFAGIEESSQHRHKGVNHSLLPSPSEFSSEKLSDGYKGLCGCLSALLDTKVSYPSEIPLDSILKLISRVFYVNYGMTNAGVATVTEPDQLRPAERLALIPIVHITTLELLDTLITKLKRHLLPHTRSILRIITQIHTRTLTRTTSTQTHAYSALAHLVEYVCGSGFWGVYEESLLAKLLNDISPPHKTAQRSILDVKLAGKSRHNNNNSGGKKKKKKVGGDGGADESANESNINMEVKCKALKALHSILMHTGSQIPPQQRTKIDQTIVAHLLKVTSDRTLQAPSAYKKGLFTCLKAAVLRPVPSCPPILVYALRLFNFGLVDECNKVVRVCKEGAAICENQVHPYVPTLPSQFLPSTPLPQSTTSSSFTPSFSTPIVPSPVTPAEDTTSTKKRKEREAEKEREEIEEEKEATPVPTNDESMVDVEEKEESEKESEPQEVLPNGSTAVVVEESEEEEVVINYSNQEIKVTQTTTTSFAATTITDDDDSIPNIDIAINDTPPDSDEDVSDLE